MTRPWGFLVLVSALVSSSALAQSERLGAVSGTWEACWQQMQRTETRYNEAKTNPKISPAALQYLRHRAAVELDKCTQLADAPLQYEVEVINRYADLKMEDRAEEIANQGLVRYGNAPDLRLAIGQVYFRKGKVDKALPILEGLVQERNDSTAAQILGAHYYQQGDVSKALPFLRIATDARPDQFAPNAALGDACLSARDLECAGTYLGRASQLKPADVLLAIKVAELQRSRGEYGLAIEAYERAIAADNKRVDAYAGLARTERAADLKEQSLATYITAMNMAPNEPSYAVEGSQVARRLGRPRQGLFFLERHLAGSRSVDARVEYLSGLVASKQMGRATEFMNATTGLDTDERWLAVTGDVALANGDLGGALTRYQGARKARPQIEAYVVREARVLRLQNRYNDAQTLLTSFESAPDSPARNELVATLLDVSRTQASAKEYAAAAKTADKAAKLAPADPDVQVAVAAVAAVNNTTKGDEAAITGAGKDALDAWRAYAKNDFATAADAAGRAGATWPQVRVLQAAALIGAGQADQALTAIADAPRDSVTAQRWYAHTIVSATLKDLKAGKSDAAMARLSSEDTSKLPDAHKGWLARVGLLHRAATGALTPADNRQVAQLAGRSGSGAFEQTLLAITEIQNKPEAALKRLRQLPASPAVSAVRTRAQLQLATIQYRNNNMRAANQTLASIQLRDLDEQSRLNAAVIKGGNDTKALMRELEPYVNKNVPEALFNQALAMDRSGRAGDESMPVLQKVLAANPSTQVKNHAEALLALKTKLYR